MRRDPAPAAPRRALAFAGLALVLAGLGGVAASGQTGSAELVAGTPYPLRGEPVELRLTGAGGEPLAGVPVTAHYRPNSETAHAEEVGTTGPDGTLTWVPTDAGVATLSAGTEAGAGAIAQAQVAVRFGAFPPVGLLVMLVAGVLLFGGAATGFWLLLKPPPHAPPLEPPST